jgi:predicted lipoprotein with Yx(FWY)xxD motif
MRVRIAVAVTVSVAGVALLGGVDRSSGSDSASATLTVRGSQYGRILFDGRNRALYAFTRDRRSRPSTCDGACAAAWPPYLVTGSLRAGAGTNRSLYGTTRRRDGTRQLTYRGWPLYYYVADPVGRVLCQNVFEFGGLWLVVRPSGQLVRLPR